MSYTPRIRKSVRVSRNPKKSVNNSKSRKVKSYYYKKSITLEKYNDKPAKGKCEVIEKLNNNTIKKVYDIKENKKGELKYVRKGKSQEKLLKV
jgi:CRISPR/Cas system type I-B associated protein Csh2 (Cas7 group RAMP superfamily)